MPYIIPKTNNYFGFMPVESPGTLAPINPYFVSSSEATAIYPGDVVTLTTINSVKVPAAGSSGGALTILGVAANFIGANGGSTAATINSNSSQLLFVYDNPKQQFVVCDSTGGLIGSTGLFKNVGICSTGFVGSTGPNTTLSRSVMALSSVGTTSGATLPFKVIGLHPIEQGLFSSASPGTGAATEVRKWIVIPCSHWLGEAVAGNATT